MTLLCTGRPFRQWLQALDADQELLIERLINNLTLDECGQVISLAEVEILARSCQSG
jgi:hypothetical protein